MLDFGIIKKLYITILCQQKIYSIIKCFLTNNLIVINSIPLLSKNKKNRQIN